ncbi:MAG: insulinase family protein [Verrucomicrobia bacterium]|nr:insulinase family protein [Verrucomicrobiota bacterium]MBI3869132.1 insulinase family protein [Verrucomicrobiota bacterium]
MAAKKTPRAPRTRKSGKTAVQDPPSDVRLITLENGLVLILREDRCAPVVSAQAWCRAGSVDEGRLLGAGLSHVLEHMLFKGTSTRSAGRIDQEVQEAGGYMNAYTSFDRTVYHINVPNTGATVAIDVLCDIMRNASIPEDELVKELDVIRREMDMGQDDPGHKSARRLFETAYTRSPYRHPIIGHIDIFNTLTREDIAGYYREKYAPNNLFFVVVGDMDADAVERQIRESFAQSKARALPCAPLTAEPRQTAARVVIEEGPIELGHLHISWHIPDQRHADVPALDVLSTLLGSGRSSRLYQRVRERLGLVNAVDAWTYNPGSQGLFGVSAVVDAEKFEAARDALLAEVARMREKPVSAAELRKAVKQFTAGTLATRKTMQGQAQDLGGSWMAAHDLHFSQHYMEAVRRLTPKDLQRVARHYLTDSGRTLYALLPKGTKPSAVTVTESHSENAVRKLVLPNGLRLLLKEEHRLPFVEFRAVFQGGVLAEDTRNNGATQLLTKMLLQGTKSRSGEAIAREIESVGGSIGSYGGHNSLGVSVEVMKADFALGLRLMVDVMRNPTFPAAALEREREIQLAEIKAHKDQLLSLADSAAREALFGPIGYGLQSRGSEATVSTLSRSDLRSLHQRLLVPANGVLSIFGNIRSSEVIGAVTQALGKWGGAHRYAPPRASVHAVNDTRRVHQPVDKKQAVLVIAFPGTTLFHEDRFALELVQEALSDLGSRLFVRIRDELGLAYYVGASNFLGLVPGYFSFYVGTDPEKATLVEAELLKQAAALAADGLTEAELKRAKAKLIGQKKIARQELGRLAMTCALDELYGLGHDSSDQEDARFEAVTMEEIRKVCATYLGSASRVISAVGPQSSASSGA